MCKTHFPNDEELNFRNAHYQCVLDVLDSDICCAICNSDLKKDIILNGDIMIHEIFLCLCCEKCFEKLSNSPSGCIFCSQYIKLKTCEICNSDMCERCIDNYCSMSKYQKTLNGCLRCSTNALWSHRSQAAAVLKCFSFELDLRLILSGKDSLDKQNICQFIISTAKCDDFTPNDIHKIRVKYLFYLLKTKIELAFYDYQTILQTKDVKQCIEHFTELCELILKSICATLLDFKCLFNDEIIESFNNKVISILRNSPLFQKTENSYSETWKMSCPNLNALNYRKNGLLIDHESSNVHTPNSSVSWGKQIIKQYSSNMGKSEAVFKNIICCPLNLTNELNEAGLNNKNVKNIPRQILGELKEFEVDDEIVHFNTESSTKINFTCTESTKISASQIVHENVEKKVVTINSFCGGNINSFDNHNPFNGRYVFKVIDADTMICEVIDSKKLVDETSNESSGSTSNINSIHESTWPEINLTTCDQEDIQNENENTLKEELVNESFESSTNINSIPEINLTICDQEDTEHENEHTFNEEVDNETVLFNIESSTKINFASKESTIIAAIQIGQENVEKKIVTINSFCGENINSFDNHNPFKGRYVFKEIDADTMICEVIDTKKLVDETINENIESSSNISSVCESTWPEINLTTCDLEDINNENVNKFNEESVNETINESTESSSNINSICESTWPEINLTICDQEGMDNENENKLNEESVNETINVSTESSLNINLIRESVWPKIYLTRCDQTDIDNENQNKLNEKLVNKTVNGSTEFSSIINSICESVWPKIYLTRCDQKNIDNENDNKLSEKLVDETVNISTESSSNINLISESVWPKIYLTRYDQKDVDNEKKNKFSKGLVDETVNVKINTEFNSNINSIRESVWPKIYLFRCDQKDIDHENENKLYKEKLDSKPVKVIRKRKFQENPNSVQTHSNYKKFIKSKKITKKNVKSNFIKNTKKRKFQV